MSKIANLKSTSKLFTSYPTSEIAKQLNLLLASTVDLYFLYKGAHWNLEGVDSFYSFHQLFDEHSNALHSTIDEIAERLRQIGHKSEADLKDYLENSQVRMANSQDYTSSNISKILKNLMAGHDSYIEQLEKIAKLTNEIQDFATNDFVINLLQKHQKMLWLLFSSQDNQ